MTEQVLSSCSFPPISCLQRMDRDRLRGLHRDYENGPCTAPWRSSTVSGEVYTVIQPLLKSLCVPIAFSKALGGVSDMMKLLLPMLTIVIKCLPSRDMIRLGSRATSDAKYGLTSFLNNAFDRVTTGYQAMRTSARPPSSRHHPSRCLPHHPHHLRHAC